MAGPDVPSMKRTQTSPKSKSPQYACHRRGGNELFLGVQAGASPAMVLGKYINNSRPQNFSPFFIFPTPSKLSHHNSHWCYEQQPFEIGHTSFAMPHRRSTDLWCLADVAAVPYSAHVTTVFQAPYSILRTHFPSQPLLRQN